MTLQEKIKADKLYNWSALSMALTGSPKTINQNKIPKKYLPDIQVLFEQGSDAFHRRINQTEAQKIADSEGLMSLLADDITFEILEERFKLGFKAFLWCVNKTYGIQLIKDEKHAGMLTGIGAIVPSNDSFRNCGEITQKHLDHFKKL